MATLREIKGRLVSIQSTRKITSAMKMVSSSKLHKAQSVLRNMFPYAKALQSIMDSLVSGEFGSPLGEQRKLQKVAIIVFASDNALCGTFNANIIRELEKTMAAFSDRKVETTLYTIGKKVYDFAHREGLSVSRNYLKLSGASGYDPLAALAEELIGLFEKREIDRVDLIYHRFKSVGKQYLVCEPFLPLASFAEEREMTPPATDYIFEPDRTALTAALIPQTLKLQLYTALLHSNASEHAIRMVAMQTATDNADELIDDLTLVYNKSRQQAITSELLDIVGGTIQER